MVEKRKFVRVDAQSMINYKVYKGGPGSKWDITRTKNISERGVLFTTKEFFPPKTLLEIKLRLPTIAPSTVDVLGEVVGSKESIPEKITYDTRVVLIETNEDDRVAIRKIVDIFSGKV